MYYKLINIMQKNYISTRQLIKTQSSWVTWNNYFIVMKHSQPSSILAPYHPEIEKAIEIALKNIELQQSGLQAIDDYKNKKTYGSKKLRKIISN